MTRVSSSNCPTQATNDRKIVRRYNAYYQGWCMAFGEHDAVYHDDWNINWLFAEDRIGLAIASELRKRISRELLGQRDKAPVVVLSDDLVKINRLHYLLIDEAERENVRRIREFILESSELHMFLCSHFCYPPRTRIITFSRKKPLAIMYKEMLPLELIIE
jgi:hypothetical protein